MDLETDRRSFERPPPNLTLQIALGVAGGILLAALIAWLALEWRARVAAEQAAQALAAIQRNAARQLEADRARRAQLEAQRQQDEASQLRARAEVQRVLEEQKRAALAEAERKELAWAAFYRKPPHCDPPAEAALVQCSNEYIRAKREFEARWAAGKPRGPR